MRKIAYFSLLILVLASPVYAEAEFTGSLEGYPLVPYGETGGMSADCEDCPYGYLYVDFTCDSGATSRITLTPHDEPEFYETFDVPHDVPCEVRTHDATLLTPSENEIDERTWRVQEKGDMKSPYVGKNIIVNLAPSAGSNGQMRAFQLTDNTWDEEYSMPAPSEDKGNIMAQRYSTGWSGNHEQEVFQASEGNIIGRYDSLEGLITGCSGDVCEDVIEKSFTSSILTAFNIWSDLDTISPLHDGDRYRPEGEIAFAYYPEYNREDQYGVGRHPYSEEGPYFFVCTEGATMDNGFGDEVPQVIDVKENFYGDSVYRLYKCDTDAGQWERTYECDTGLDHDGDGEIDHPASDYHNTFSSPGAGPDNNCDSPRDNNEAEGGIEDWTCDELHDDQEGCDNMEGCAYTHEDYCLPEPDCTEGVAVYDSIEEEWNAYYEVTGGCYETGIQEDVEPEIFYCDEEDGPSDTSRILGGGDSRSETCSGMHYSFYSDDSYGDGEMPVAEYTITEEYLNEKCSEDSNCAFRHNDTLETDWIEPYSGQISKHQSLMEAEQKYSPVSWPPEAVHSPDTWEQLGMINVSGNYFEDTDDRETSLHEHAWTLGNAGETNQDLGDTTFEGGFAGLCPEEQAWQYKENPITGSTEWHCSGEIEWDQAVLLPQIGTMEPGDQTMSMGLIAMGYNNKEEHEYRHGLGYDEIRGDITRGWMSYPEATERAEHRDQDFLDEMDGVCWPGSLDAMPDTSDPDVEEGVHYISDTVEVHEGYPYGFTGEINASTDPDFDLSQFNGYSCNWEYTTTDGYTVNVTGEERELHKMIPELRRSSTQPTSDLTREEWTALMSGHIDYTVWPSTPIEAGKAVKGMRVLSESLGWQQEGREGMLLFANEVYEGPEDLGAEPLHDGYTVGWKEGSSAITGVFMDSGTMSPYNLDECYEDTSFQPVEYRNYPVVNTWQYWADDEDDPDAYQLECPNWPESGEGPAGEPIEWERRLERIGWSDMIPSEGERFEDGAPLINFIAAYNNPQTGSSEYGHLQLRYDSPEELEQHLTAWEDMANQYVRAEWTQRPSGHIDCLGCIFVSDPDPTEEDFEIEYSSDDIHMGYAAPSLEVETEGPVSVSGLSRSCPGSESCTYNFNAEFDHSEVEGSTQEDYEIAHITVKLEGRPQTEVTTTYAVQAGY